MIGFTYTPRSRRAEAAERVRMRSPTLTGTIAVSLSNVSRSRRTSADRKRSPRPPPPQAPRVLAPVRGSESLLVRPPRREASSLPRIPFPGRYSGAESLSMHRRQRSRRLPESPCSMTRCGCRSIRVYSKVLSSATPGRAEEAERVSFVGEKKGSMPMHEVKTNAGRGARSPSIE